MAANGERESNRSAFDTIGTIASALTLAGILIYGLIYYALLNFYEDLDISPDEIGLTQGAIIVKAAISVLFLVVLVLPPLTLMAWGLRFLIRARAKSQDAAEEREPRLWVLCYALATMFLILSVEVLVLFRSLIVRSGLLLLLVLLCSWVALRLARRLLARGATAFSPAAIILGAWITYLVIALPILGIGEERGRKLWQTGDTSIIQDFAGTAIIGWIRCVQLTWTGDKDQTPSTLPRNPVLRLGSKDGMLIVVNQNAALPPQVQYVPLGSVIVSDAGDRCKL